MHLPFQNFARWLEVAFGSVFALNSLEWAIANTAPRVLHQEHSTINFISESVAIIGFEFEISAAVQQPMMQLDF